MKERKVIYFKKPKFEAYFDVVTTNFPKLAMTSLEEWMKICVAGMPMSFLRLQEKLYTTARNLKEAEHVYPFLDSVDRFFFESELEVGEVEMPIVIDNKGELILLHGNTTLTGLVKEGKEALVWMVTYIKE